MLITLRLCFYSYKRWNRMITYCTAARTLLSFYSLTLYSLRMRVGRSQTNNLQPGQNLCAARPRGCLTMTWREGARCWRAVQPCGASVFESNSKFDVRVRVLLYCLLENILTGSGPCPFLGYANQLTASGRCLRPIRGKDKKYGRACKRCDNL